MGRLKKTKTIICDQLMQNYIVQTPNPNTGQTYRTGVSFDYALYKASKLYAALCHLGMRGCVQEPLKANWGFETGYLDYVRISNEAKAYHELTGYVFKDMLHPQFIGLEGCRVWADGQHFWVATKSKYAPMHIKTRTKGAVHGRRITETYNTITVLEHAHGK